MKKNEIYSITKLLRKKHEELEEQYATESNPDELMWDLMVTIRCVIDITELMLQDEEDDEGQDL